MLAGALHSRRLDSLRSLAAAAGAADLTTCGSIGDSPALPFDFNHSRRCPSKDLRRIHLLGLRWRGLERPRGRGANDVVELVTALGETGREELNAIVEALDVIEAAALPPGNPGGPSVTLIATRLRQRPRRGGKPRFDGLEPCRQRVGHSHVAPLLRQV